MGAGLKSAGKRASLAKETAALPSPAAVSGLRIGLLGGSFNPAHQGHQFISREALKRLKLDRVWWLVSPQNPLKPHEGMAGLEARLEGARAVARHPRIRPTGIEAALGTRYTADTLAELKARFARTRFVWLMGADNLAQIPRWEDWTYIFHTVPIAVFDRPSYSHKALAGIAARRFRKARVEERKAPSLAARTPPAWCFLHIPLMPVSATQIRARAGAERPGATNRRGSP